MRRALALWLCLSTVSLPAAAAPANQTPEVELVFVLDTTGSMSGLLEGAKRKIWSVVNEVLQGRPRPRVRVGLVAYRDHGDAYVTRLTPLTEDLDAVYADLLSLQAGGGGDGPEHVNRGLHDALHLMQWSPRGSRALRAIFLVGDAPAHVEYQDVPGYPATVLAARQRGLYVNAVRCGPSPDTGAQFREVARLGGGDFLTIDQGGGMVAVTTPFDAELGRLSRDLDGTYVLAGSAVSRRKARAALDAAAASADRGGSTALAERASVRAKVAAAPAPAAEADLVGAFEAAPEAAEARLAEDEALPEPMRALDLAGRKRYLAEKAAERADIRDRIAALSEQRRAWLEANPQGGEDGFDRKVIEVVRRQASEAAGIRY